jgi:hypothetical protein
MFTRYDSLARAAAALLVLTLATAPAMAGERLYWSGKDATGCRYSFTDGGNGHWTSTMTFQGETLPGDFTEVSRCDEFIELQLEGRTHRLYKDKYLIQRPNGRWLEMAKGKWRD